MPINIENKCWGEFFIEDIAEISSGRDIYDAERVYGDIPYISSTAKNNGIGYLVGNINNTIEENCLSVNRNGSVGYSFYHPYKGLFSNDCRKLRPIIKSTNIGIFLSNQITKQREKYNYGYKMGTARLKRQKIMLPINAAGEPDWQFMEQYSKQLIESKKLKYIEYSRQELSKIEFREVRQLKDCEWKEFFIKDIFKIKIGKNIDGNKVDKDSGQYPYITRKEVNNGVDGFLSYDKSFLSTTPLVITIGNETAYPFVQLSPFFTGTKVNIMEPKFNPSKYILSFIATSIKKHKEKYSFSYSINSSRLKRQKILLPVTNSGEPDYMFMEQYMMNIEHIKRKQYLNHMESQKNQ